MSFNSLNKKEGDSPCLPDEQRVKSEERETTLETEKYDRIAKMIEDEGIKKGDKFMIVLETGHSTTEATFESLDKTRIHYTGRSGRDIVNSYYEISPIAKIKKLESK
jgi:hypothetical protein